MNWHDSLILRFFYERSIAFTFFTVVIIAFTFPDFNIIAGTIFLGFNVIVLSMHYSENKGLTSHLLQFIVIIASLFVVVYKYNQYIPVDEFVRTDHNMTYAYSKGKDAGYKIRILKDNKIQYSFDETDVSFIRFDRFDINITKSNDRWYHEPEEKYEIVGRY